MLINDEVSRAEVCHTVSEGMTSMWPEHAVFDFTRVSRREFFTKCFKKRVWDVLSFELSSSWKIFSHRVVLLRTVDCIAKAYMTSTSTQTLPGLE